MFVFIIVGIYFVGFIVYSGQLLYGKEVYGLFDYYQFLYDVNLIMIVFLDVLVYWINKYLLFFVLYF